MEINQFKANIAYLLNIFRKDALTINMSAFESIIGAIVYFAVFAFIVFGYGSWIGLTQLLQHIIYPIYADVQVLQTQNYGPMILIAIIGNLIFTIVIGAMTYLYIYLDGAYKNKFELTGKYLLQLSCHCSKVFSILGSFFIIVASVYMVPFLKLSILHEKLHTSSFVWFSIFFMIILSGLTWIVLIRPVSYIRDNTSLPEMGAKLSSFDRTFSISFVIILAISLFFAGYVNAKIVDWYAKKGNFITSNKGNCYYNLCKFIIDSPNAPVGVKAAFKDAGCDRVQQCYTLMPDVASQDQCIKQLYWASPHFITMAKYSNKNICRFK